MEDVCVRAGMGGRRGMTSHPSLLADFHQTDRYNRPIFIQDLSYLKVNDVFVHTTPERIINFFALMLEDAVQRRYAVCTELSRQQARKAGTTDAEALKKIVIDDNFMILNVEGLGMGTFWSVSVAAKTESGAVGRTLTLGETTVQEPAAAAVGHSRCKLSRAEWPGADHQVSRRSGREWPRRSFLTSHSAPWLFTTIFSYIKGWLPVNSESVRVRVAEANSDAVSAQLCQRLASQAQM